MSEGKRAGVEAEVGDRKGRVVSFAGKAGANYESMWSGRCGYEKSGMHLHPALLRPSRRPQGTM